MGKLYPRRAYTLLRDTHVVADHVPVDHWAVRHGRGARAGRRGRIRCQRVRDKRNADGQNHAENNSKQHAHGGLPKAPTYRPAPKTPRTKIGSVAVGSKSQRLRPRLNSATQVVNSLIESSTLQRA